MKDLTKYQGIFPAFYACYDQDGKVSPQTVRDLARYFLDKGVKGLYVGGSSGECIYQSVAERKLTLENVMAEVGGKLTIIAHVACNNTADSHRQVLERHFRCGPQHGFRHLQHPPAGGRSPDGAPAEGNAEESPGYRRQELLHARPGHPDVDGRGRGSV